MQILLSDHNIALIDRTNTVRLQQISNIESVLTLDRKSIHAKKFRKFESELCETTHCSGVATAEAEAEVLKLQTVNYFML